MTRRRSVPEIIQSSAMDCGPACLAALLRGHGIQASYERLREACQTDVDGTSIDAIEAAAVRLGLDAEQSLIPLDYVLSPESAALPSIAVVRRPDGVHHFVILWRRRGDRVQVMDPAVGRYTRSERAVVSQLHVHEMEVPAEAWREWAGSDELCAPLRRRLRSLQIASAEAMLAVALEDRGWSGLATLDAAARAAQALVTAGVIATGSETSAVVDALVRAPEAIAPELWSARATDEPAMVRIRGAVVVRARGVREQADEAGGLPDVVAPQRQRPWSELARLMLAGGVAAPVRVVVLAVLAAMLVIVQAALSRALLETAELTPLHVLAAFGVVIVAMVMSAAVEMMLFGGAAHVGRMAEATLRMRWIGALATASVRYFQSRPRSDLASRAHSLHRVRELPRLCASIVRTVAELTCATIAIVWIAPGTAWVALVLLAAVLLPPLAGHRSLAERELAVRGQHDAMSGVLFEALRGALAIRAHGGAHAIEREHARQAIAWARESRREHRVAVTIAVAQGALVVAAMTGLIASYIAQPTVQPGVALLLAYWASTITTNGAALAQLVRELPVHRNLALRLFEPLSTLDARCCLEHELPEGAAGFDVADATAIARGNVVLDGVSLSIAPGEHVALVGRSGAGKSSVLRVLLGTLELARGSVRVDGLDLAEASDALHRRTAWLDPATQLWSSTLGENVAFGAPPDADLSTALGDAELEAVLAQCARGLQTPLGDRGGLLSGGEGQRVRFARALLRRDVAFVALDEPFRGLPRARRSALLARARERWRGATLVCATHDLAETTAFDRVVVIDGGRVVEDGPPAVLASSPSSRYATYLAEERATRAVLAGWRSLRLHHGQIVVEHAP